MVSQPERRVLWHPRGEDRFAVSSGSQIILYEYAPDEPAIRDIASQQDLSPFKCFAWSPTPLASDLFATGLPSGRVDLLRLCEPASTGPRPTHAHSHSLSHAPRVSLYPRTARPCTALAFCPAAPHYLAQGLDKARGDAGLIIWDLHTAAAAALSLSLGPTTTTSPTPLTAPPPSPSIPLTPLPLPSSPTRSTLTLPRLDPLPRTDARALQTHAPADPVPALAWLPHTPHLLAAAAPAPRLFDLRAPTTTAALAFGTGRARALAAAPAGEFWLAAAGADGGLCVWDTRWLGAGAPLLAFSARDAAGAGVGAWGGGGGVAGGGGSGGTGGAGGNGEGEIVLEMEFSRARRGVLAVLEKDAAYVRFWDILGVERGFEVSAEEPGAGGGEVLGHDAAGAGAGRGKLASWTPWSAGGAARRPERHDGGAFSAVLADTRTSAPTPHPLASFALVPPPPAPRVPLTTPLITLTRAGALGVGAVYDAPAHARWSARGAAVLGVGADYRWFAPAPPAPEDEGAGVDGAGVHVERGRAAVPAVLVPSFGRGDEEGFPALGGGGSQRPSPRMGPAHLHAHKEAGPKERDKEREKEKEREREKEKEKRRMRSQPASPRPHPRAPPSVPASPARGVARLAGDTESVRAVVGRVQVQVQVRTRSKSARALERVGGVVEEDVSMVMRRRAARGYGLGNPYRNAVILKEEAGERERDADGTLVELWTWIHQSRELLNGPGPRPDAVFNGYDFAGQGLLGIWDSFPLSLHGPLPNAAPSPAAYQRVLDSESVPAAMSRSRSRRGKARPDPYADFVSAILALCAARGVELGGDEKDKAGWRPAVPTARLVQRRFALLLVGWSLREDDLGRAIARWEKEGRFSQAACWLVFVGRHSKAIDLLMRSKDESHHLMSGTIAALMPTRSGAEKPPELRAHCERLILRLQDPYFRAMLTYLALADYSEVLEEDALPLAERLAIALQFLDDAALSAYLRRVADRAVARGDAGGLVLTGVAGAGLDVLQSFVDRTGDVQTAAVLGACVARGAGDGRVRRWVEVYRELLDGWRMFRVRCQLDIERGAVVRDGRGAEAEALELAKRQVVLRCNYCNKVISAPQGATASRATGCPFCNRALPRCSVCLMNISVVPDAVRDGQLAHHNARLRDTIDDAVVFCQTCRHGGHAAHILEWFYGEAGARSHGVCAIASCDCRCASEAEL
ncbi:hypothetical protein DENSPDRAFT_873810 [Dentipellis sp. KUC8613]|nr:hypothetical protein DENSPDRAFT_873810 [Dentipellis sp. KUC8613]